MRNGFTLLELIVVIIIIGILATLGFTQYSKVIEKARGAEAKTIIGSLRSQALALYLEYANVTTASNMTTLGVVDSAGNIPATCASAVPSKDAYFFNYSVAPSVPDQIIFTATRCTIGGKTPQVTGTPGRLQLTTNVTAGTDTWQNTAPY